MKNKVISTILAIILLVAVLPFSSQAEATSSLVNVNLSVSSGINLFINEILIQPTDVNGKNVSPFVYNGTTYLPARAIANAYGAKIDWNGDTGSIYIDTSTAGELTSGNTSFYEHYSHTKTLSAVKGVKIFVNNSPFTPTDSKGNPVDAYIVDGTTYLPLRAIAGVFNSEVAWASDEYHFRVYLGRHVVREVSDGSYILQSDPKYVYPTENDSQAVLEARAVATQDELNRCLGLVDKKQLYIANVSGDYLKYYQEYRNCSNKEIGQKYMNLHKKICNQMDYISSPLGFYFDSNHKYAYSMGDATAEAIRNDGAHPGKGELTSMIINGDEEIEAMLKHIAIFGPEEEQYFRNRFEQLHNEFLKEIGGAY